MADKQKILSRLRKAVDRKSEQADEASRAPTPAEDKVHEAEQHTLTDPGTPQDVASPRDKNTRHGKVTADKWNQ